MERNGNWRPCGRLMTIVGLGLGQPRRARRSSAERPRTFTSIRSPRARPARSIARAPPSAWSIRRPARLTVPRHKDNIVVSCALDGYEQSNEVLASSFTGATLGNILLGGIVGVIIDASSGANNKYPERSRRGHDARRPFQTRRRATPTMPAEDAHLRTRRTPRSSGSTTTAQFDQASDLCTIEAKQIAEARDKAVADSRAEATGRQGRACR